MVSKKRHLSGPDGLQLGGLGHLLLGEERLGRPALDGAGEPGVEAGEGTGVGDAVGGGDLGGADRPGC